MNDVTWKGAPEEDGPPIGIGGWLRASVRMSIVLVVILIGVVLSIPAMGVDRVLRKRSAGSIRQIVCVIALKIVGLRLTVRGAQDRAARLYVANHVSWLDIFVINGSINGCFVAKSEVRRWPGIGLLARFGGTEFINRGRGATRDEMLKLDTSISSGKRLILFPEGTSSDGLQVLPFRSSMVQMCFRDGWDARWAVQPVSVIYHGPKGGDPRFYGWWGDMSFGAHFIKAFAARRHGHVEVIFHSAQFPAASADRKSLTAALEEAVAAPFTSR